MHPQDLNQQQNNINSLVSALAKKGLKYVVISPGSRNAPLLMAFQRHSSIKCFSVIDERSAGFIALGMAKKLQEPVALLCTSGSAVLNYYPAISEAFYMQVPLIAISADRPPELLDRWDGQAIHQFDVFKNHIRGSYNTPENTEAEQCKTFYEMGANAYSNSMNPIAGPTHINVPLREPLYEAAETAFEYPVFELLQSVVPDQISDLPVMDEKFFSDFSKILILNGAANQSQQANQALNKIKKQNKVVVLSDIISNKHSENSFQNWESILLNANDVQKLDLIPDLLITTGKMVLSKSLKSLLKKSEIKLHWHIAENGYCADTFFSLPKVFKLSDFEFFEQFNKHLPESLNNCYSDIWSRYSESQSNESRILDSNDFNEFNLMSKVLKALPRELLNLNISNSMGVRLAAYNLAYFSPNWNVYSNRGVSGIDGCSSTALGIALIDPIQNYFITGDLAFLYDINAFLVNEIPKNLKVVIMNNDGGGIFRNIEGPSKMQESNPFVYTPHQLNAKHLASHYKVRYISAANQEQFDVGLHEFIQCQGICFFEVFSDSNHNTQFFNQYKQIQI